MSTSTVTIADHYSVENINERPSLLRPLLRDVLLSQAANSEWSKAFTAWLQSIDTDLDLDFTFAIEDNLSKRQYITLVLDLAEVKTEEQANKVAHVAHLLKHYQDVEDFDFRPFLQLGSQGFIRIYADKTWQVTLTGQGQRVSNPRTTPFEAINDTLAYAA